MCSVILRVSDIQINSHTSLMIIDLIIGTQLYYNYFIRLATYEFFMKLIIGENQYITDQLELYDNMNVLSYMFLEGICLCIRNHVFIIKFILEERNQNRISKCFFSSLFLSLYRFSF